MNVTAVAIISIIFGCSIALVGMILKHRSQSRLNSVDSERLQAEISQLKERVATLEKIVTDEKYQLKKEFDSLS
ncbi:hypothetical protein [Planctobacterium marinum]|uniref:hypothetical protein n=1 Tax=Planctobacterium marinum TaxID=1631968 RepID=UPI001E5914C7|nr:hypothetical protein [Planctobacterium marinum]MCC2606300.1 hypothetical protein [Planctobacterium marinum]